MSKNPRDKTKTASHFISGEPTRVDLGDDLVEKTAQIETETRSVLIDEGKSEGNENPDWIKPIRMEDIPDQLESARILLNEDLIDQAKRVLRQILITDPGNAPAKKRLKEVHDLELKQILGSRDRGTRRALSLGRPDESAASPNTLDAENVMRKLDEDWSLGIFSGTEESQGKAAEGLDEWMKQLEEDRTPEGTQARVDLGVAFLEMGLHAISLRLLHSAEKEAVQQKGRTSTLARSATSLLSLCQILSGHPFDATVTLQPYLRDIEMPSSEKIEFIYLMGRAYEALNRNEAAIQWYAQTQEIEPGYRDAEQRRLALREMSETR